MEGWFLTFLVVLHTTGEVLTIRYPTGMSLVDCQSMVTKTKAPADVAAVTCTQGTANEVILMYGGAVTGGVQP